MKSQPPYELRQLSKLSNVNRHTHETSDLLSEIFQLTGNEMKIDDIKEQEQKLE